MVTHPRFGCSSNVFNVCFRSSKWQKASKCKNYIQSLLLSTKLHRRRREAMVTQSRSDIAQLRLDCRFSEALPKVKHIYEDERRLSAYDKIEDWCTFILKNFSQFTRQMSDVNLLPEETKEAIAGLIFAAARIGELKELQLIRNLFVERYGLEFDKDNVDLRPGNLVSSEMIKFLDTRMLQKLLTPEFVTGIISESYQTNIATCVDSSEDSASKKNNIGNVDSDEVKIEKLKTVVWRKKVMKENSKILHPNLGESQARDR